MDRATRFRLTARAAGTAVVHATVGLPLVLFWLALFGFLGAIVATFVVGYASLVPFAPDGVVAPLAALFVLTAAAWGLYYAAGELRERVHEGREQLLARVEPVHAGGDDAAETLAAGGGEPGPGVRERARELFDAEATDEPGDGDPVDDATRRRFASAVRRLSLQADVPSPIPAVHPAAAPLCYTVHHEGAAVLVVSRGLLRTLPPAELEAVVAHEVAHLANDDHRFMTWATVPLLAVERPTFGGDHERPDPAEVDPEWWGLDRRQTAAVALVLGGHVLVLLGLVALATGVPFLDMLVWTVRAVAFLAVALVAVAAVTVPVYLALFGTAYGFALALSALHRAAVAWAQFGTGLFSRGRELAADRAAARLTGDPGALASALERLGDSLPERPPEDLRDHVHTRDALNVVPALDPEHDGGGGLLATHPATETRVERLRDLEREQETA